jgi:HK97 family phage major capsid protein
MKKFLEDLIKAKEARAAELRKIVDESEDIVAVRNAVTELRGVTTEIDNARAQLLALDAQGGQFNPMATYGQGNGNPATDNQRNDDPYATMEYRTAFMNYVRTGERAAALTVERRADDPTELNDLGVLIPTTVVNEIIKGVEKKRGQLYARVKKTNLKGGIKYPIGAFSATFNRITEKGAPSARQSGGEVTGYVEFGYKIGEVRLAKTLLMSVMGVSVFEAELAKILVEAYVEAMELEIINGNPANNQMCGILNNSADGLQKIAADHIIEMTADDVADWTKWESKLFANIPLSMEGESPVFVMAKQTYVGNLCTLADSNGQPVKKAGFDVTDRMHKFNEYEVVRVEKDIFKDFDSCANGEYFGMFAALEKAYGINSNLNFAVTRYYDNEKNEWVEKGIVINDGKIIDPKYIFLLKKKVVSA